jgi:parvulin-like peptidyl-prolyl isomerase
VTPTELIALVGDQAILAGDILPTVEQTVYQAIEKIPPDQRDVQRAMLVRQLLPRKIEVKLVLVDFYRTIPRDKLKEVLANIDKQVEKQFYDQQLPRLLEQLGVEFLVDADNKLAQFGSSIAHQKSEFREQMVAQTMIGQNTEQLSEITHEKLLEYYQQHSQEYERPARARWEQLTARFDKFPDKAAADLAIVEMGNQVLRGADLAAVARKFSHDPAAINGGLHEWTSQGSLVSEVLDQAIFSLPLQRLSQKLEDDQGFHIIRVLDREDAGRVEFVDAQDEIREILREKQRKQKMQEYLEGLRDKTYIWTIFDDPNP